MGRFQVGQKVEFWAYFDPQAWVGSEVVEVGEDEHHFPVVSIRDPKSGLPMVVPGIFLRHPLDEGRQFPDVVYPVNMHKQCRVGFPQYLDGPGMSHAVKFTVSFEDTNNGTVNSFDYWVRFKEGDSGDPADRRVFGSLTWDIGRPEVEAQCNVGCKNENCGSESWSNDAVRAAKTTAGIAVQLRLRLATGAEPLAALTQLYDLYVQEATSVTKEAEQVIMDEARAHGLLPPEDNGGVRDTTQPQAIPSELRNILDQLGLSAGDVTIVNLSDLGGDGGKGDGGAAG